MLCVSQPHANQSAGILYLSHKLLWLRGRERIRDTLTATYIGSLCPNLPYHGGEVWGRKLSPEASVVISHGVVKA